MMHIGIKHYVLRYSACLWHGHEPGSSSYYNIKTKDWTVCVMCHRCQKVIS